MLTSREATADLLDTIDRIVEVWEAVELQLRHTDVRYAALMNAVADARDTARYVREATDAETLES